MLLSTLLAVLVLGLTLVTLVWLGAGAWGAAAKTGAALLLACAGFAAFLRREVVIFDRQAGTVVIRTASLFGRSEIARNLHDILGAEALGNPAGVTRRKTWRPEVRLSDGTSLALTQVYIGDGSAKAIAGAVNDWCRLTGG